MTAAAAATIVVQGTCGQTFDVDVSGGAAGWTLSCSGGNIRAIGWVKDTDADGKAAEVYGTWQNGDSFGVVRAGEQRSLELSDERIRILMLTPDGQHSMMPVDVVPGDD